MKQIIVLALVGLCVWLSTIFPHDMLSPGELVADHQKLNDKCKSCHNPFGGIPNEKCTSCHKLSEIGKDSLGSKPKILFHNKLGKQQCVACHTDHKGLNPTTSLGKFDHSLLASSDQSSCIGCHDKPSDKLHNQLSTSCSNCHNTNSWKSEVVFDHNMIQGFDKSNCISCHQKPNDSYHSSFEGNCLKCHNTEKWVPSTFDHSSYFVLDQNHNAKCSTCHGDNNFSAYSCYGCHEHSESKIREEHTEEGIYNFSDCVSCHKSGNEHDVENNKGEKGKHKKDDDDD